MKEFPRLAKIGLVAFAIASPGLFLSSAHAQDYYFDPGLVATGTANASGGDGIWDTGITPDFYHSGGVDTTFPAAAAGIADFDGSGGTVIVNGSVDPIGINFDGSTPYTVNAGTAGSIDLGEATNFNITDSGTDATINAPITFTGSPQVNYITTYQTYNGGPIYTGTFGPSISIAINNTGSGNLVFGSTVTNTQTASNGDIQWFQLDFQSGTTEFSGNILGANSGFDPASGSLTNDNLTVEGGATVLVDNGNFDRFQVHGTLLTNGPVTINAQDDFTSAGNSAGGTLGGATADLSTFTGNIANFGGTMTLTAAAGGRVNFSGQIFGSGVGAGNDVIINGPGIVAFTNPSGNTYAVQYNSSNPADNANVGTEVKQGTLLLENANQNSSATGNGYNQAGGGLGANDVVQIDANISGVLATLGGTGWSLEQVVAMGATSSFTPGDISKDGVITPGTLHLFNGLTATSGLTANFELTLNPSTSSMIDLGITSINPDNGNPTNGGATYALDLNGPITINLMGTIDPNQTYTLFYSAWDPTPPAWDIGGADFIFNGVPAGYTAYEAYNGDDINGNESLTVSFGAVPEPSDWGLMGLGGLLLVGAARFRKVRA